MQIRRGDYFITLSHNIACSSAIFFRSRLCLVLSLFWSKKNLRGGKALAQALSTVQGWLKDIRDDNILHEVNSSTTTRLTWSGHLGQVIPQSSLNLVQSHFTLCLELTIQRKKFLWRSVLRWSILTFLDVFTDALSQAHCPKAHCAHGRPARKDLSQIKMGWKRQGS